MNTYNTSTERIERSYNGSKPLALPLSYAPSNQNKWERKEVEPSSVGYMAHCSTIELLSHNWRGWVELNHHVILFYILK